MLDQPLSNVAAALRKKVVSAGELAEEAILRHEATDSSNHAYKLFDADGARALARQADSRLATESTPPPLCGIPVSVKDLYGVVGLPTFAGTSRRLPTTWEADGWLVAALREQGAVFMGKTHTVELAFGAVGMNPHWDTPRNPWDGEVHRIPGGSSSGAGVSLSAGSALLALGTDTGGSIRIPASMTGAVGHKTTKGRWPTTGVVPLSSTLDTVGALSRSVADSVYFFGAVDPAWGDSEALRRKIPYATSPVMGSESPRLAVPQCGIWADCQSDIADVLQGTLDELALAGWARGQTDGGLLDTAVALYMSGGIAAAECAAFLERDLPGWREHLHRIVGDRLDGASPLDSDRYSGALRDRVQLMARAHTLFEHADILALPTVIITPPPVSELERLERYGETNVAALRPTCPISMLGLCAVTIPVGLDRMGMPVGLQLVAPPGRDEQVLGAALAAERVIGTARARLGMPPAPYASPDH